METDELIKVNDAQIRTAHARADIAGKMADVATKVAQLGIIREETIKKRLENVAKAFDIQWDKQAHDHLLRIRNQALQEARQLESEAENIKRHANRINRLLSGDGSWAGIRDAWIAFEYFRGRAPTNAAVRMGSLTVEPDAYKATSWRHPDRRQVTDVPEEERDLGSLWHWARTKTLYPRSGSPAWAALAAYMDAMAASITTRAAELRQQADEAEKEALELAKIDWDRLKEKN